MNVSIRDRSVYEALNPADVAAYLLSANWKQVEHQPGRSSIWQSTFDGESVELLLPLNREIKDYIARMAETIPLIAAIEKRSELEVLGDIQTAGADVVRIRYRHAAAADGSILLDQGEALVDNAREMMLAGACAEVQRKAYFAAGKSEEARRFVRGLRLGQTERGSYVLTVLSRVSPSLRPQHPSLFDDPEEPFERRAIARLATALTALRTATDRAQTAFDAEAFQNAVPAGVSANLCSAIVGMHGTEGQQTDELRISFTFARSRPTEPSTPREVSIPRDRVAMIAEAARLYRASAPPEETEIRGAVVQLKRDEPRGAVSGPITVMAFIEGKPRRVQITLDEPSHLQAMQAYERGAEISCTGDLVKQGGGWVLQNPKGFTVAAGE